MLLAHQIATHQDDATGRWHASETPDAAGDPAASPFEQLVLEQHRANFDLWHREDSARDPHASDTVIAEVKHAIDHLNQRRNDLVERLDLVLLAAVEQRAEAPLHSETPGLIIDRLSILSLKIFHTAEQTGRADVSDEHRLRNRERLRVLEEQRADLALCLAELWTEVNAGRRRFKLYRQMKMYNDPTLNPVLYGAAPVLPPDLTAPGEASGAPPV